MQDFSVLEILKLGLPGLVFLLTFLSYTLLSKEQKKPIPSEPMLRTIRFFMNLSLLFALLTLLAPVTEFLFLDRLKIYDIAVRVDDGIVDRDEPVAVVCHDAEYRNRYLLVTDKETFKMFQVVASRILPCQDGESRLLLSKGAQILLGWTPERSEGQVQIAAAPLGLQFVMFPSRDN